ncbi:MAG: metallophosphoesterase [Planctomycetota bacterium]
MELVSLLLALVGHGFLWAAFFNHSHATGWPRWIVNAMTGAGLACAVLILAVFGLRFAGVDLAALNPGGGPIFWLARLYLVACWIAGAATVALWLRRRAFTQSPALLRYHRTRLIDLPGLARGDSPDASSATVSPASPADLPLPKHAPSFLFRVPGNQICKLDVAERAVEVPRLAAALDRLKIVHLTDLHFTGKVPRTFFDEVVRLSNQIEPDLVAVTGDLIDRAECIDWIPKTLGKLTSRYGVYFVLGNHDLWVDTDRLRRTLTDSGLVDLGGRWMELRVRGERVILAGNGLPWIPPAPDLNGIPPPSSEGGPLRIALAHTPDQFRWARTSGVDLLLAGHTHGGQIRLPLIGPLLSATRLGVQYSSGLFHVAPTLLHVTRGISGQIPIRLNCPPELATLVLRITPSSET